MQLKQFLSKKFTVVVAVNLLLALAAAHFLGNAAGWLVPARDAYGLVFGYGLPFLQFIALAALLEQTMWAVAETRAPRRALQMATFVIYTVLLAMAVSIVLEKSLTTFLGASGVIGLVLGFALRGLVADVFSGIALQIDGTIAQGDWIEFHHRGHEMHAKVLEITWRTLVLADRSENIVTIPNGEFATLMVTNCSRPTRASEYFAAVDLGAEHDESRIRAILQTALDRAVSDGVLLAAPAPYVFVARVHDGTATYRMFYCLDVDRVPPAKASHVTLQYAMQYLKAAGVPVTHVQRNEIARPGAVGQFHHEHADARLQMLASTPFLSILAPRDLATVAAEVRTARLGAGQRLLVAGEPGDSMFVVSEGSLDVVVESEAGPVTVGQVWPGDCLGEMSLFTGAPRSAHVVAREPSVAFEVRKDTMGRIFASNPALVERVAATIAEREKATQSALRRPADAGDGRAETRSMLKRIRDFFHLRTVAVQVPPVETTV